MPLSRQQPNQYNATPNACTTSTEGGLDFGFVASRVHVLNDKASAVFVVFDSTTPSTGGHRTCAGESLVVEGLGIAGMGLASTTTTTGTVVRVLALGG